MEREKGRRGRVCTSRLWRRRGQRVPGSGKGAKAAWAFLMGMEHFWEHVR